jgi:hypothetical protein
MTTAPDADRPRCCPACGQPIRARRDPNATLAILQDMIVLTLAGGPCTANDLQRILHRRRTDPTRRPPRTRGDGRCRSRPDRMVAHRMATTTRNEDVMEPGVRTTLRDGQIGQSPLSQLSVTVAMQDDANRDGAEKLARLFSEYGVAPRFVTIERPRLRRLRLAWRALAQRLTR